MRTVVEEYLQDFREEAKLILMRKKTKYKSDNIATSLIEMKARELFRKFYNRLLKGDQDERLYAKMLKLELEYLRKQEKIDLSNLIKRKTGRPAHGTYTLEEIGKVFNLTRERVRQIEQNVIGTHDKVKGHYTGGKLSNPIVSRILKDYTGE